MTSVLADSTQTFCRATRTMATDEDDEKRLQARENRFRSLLHGSGLAIVDMAGDGNCLFRSVAHQVYGDPELHQLVREKCAKYMELESAYFRNFVPDDVTDFSDYIARIRRSGTWGDNLEIQAMSEIYERPIEVYAYSLTPLKTFQSASKGSPIRLSYHFKSHYNSIIDPATHHLHVATSTPGEIENAKLRMSVLRSKVAFDKTRQASDVEATDMENVRAALEASRQDFQQQSSDDFDKVVRLSLEQALDDDLAAATKASLQELDQKFMEDDVKQAIALSLQTSGQSTRSANGKSPNQDLLDLPAPVRFCHTSLGYSLEECIEAYSAVKEDGLSEQEIGDRMANLLLSFAPPGHAMNGYHFMSPSSSSSSSSYYSPSKSAKS